MITQRQYLTLPDLPARGPLPPMVGVVMPCARTNLVTNPSFELATTGYTNTGTSITRTAQFQYHGVYSLQVLPSVTVNTGAYYAITLAANTTYAISAKFISMEPTNGTTLVGKTLKLWVGDTSGTQLALTEFKSNGRWQWITLLYTERAGATRRIYFTKGNDATADSFCIDGVQVEAISDDFLAASTYIDGDQIGLLAGQSPPVYAWNGTPHASTSYRTALTRVGGVVMNWQQAYAFMLTGMIGLGSATPNNVSIPYSVLDGARFIRTTKPPRTISFQGRFQAPTITALRQYQAEMQAALDRDLCPVQQPLVLFLDPQDDCGNSNGDFATIQAIYAGGLEGDETNTPIIEAAPTFTMYVPYLIGGSDGVALIPRQTVTNMNYIVERTSGGNWQGMGTGANNLVQSLAYAVDGTLYAGGSFTDMGGTGADYLASWNGSAWSVVGSATALGALVAALAPAAAGGIYLAGAFVNAGGVADADRIAYWDGAAYNALGTGLNSGANAMALAGDGSLFVGGAFTNAGGTAANRVAKWDGSAWSALGAGISGGGAQVNALAIGLDGSLYVGGDFTTAGATPAANIARWNGSAWSALTTGLDGPVYALAIGPDGSLYVTGDFTTAGGVSAVGIAKWNGTGWAALGSGLGGTGIGYALKFDTNGVLYVGGDFTTAGGMTITDRAARWNGSTWLPLDVNLPGTATVYAFAVRPDGDLTIGFSTSGSGTAGVVVSTDNANRAITWPILRMIGPSAGFGNVYQIINLTNGGAMYFSNLILAPGEIATLNFDPQQFSFSSNTRGDLSSAIAPGSTQALMFLAPGQNNISFYAAGVATVAELSWQRRYNSLADLVR